MFEVCGLLTDSGIRILFLLWIILHIIAMWIFCKTQNRKLFIPIIVVLGVMDSFLIRFLIGITDK